MNTPAAPGDQEFPTEFTAHSVTGAIRVRTSEGGVPVAVTVEPDKLKGDPDALAGEILRLCKQSAARAGLARRKQLEAAGYTEDMLRMAGLPTEAEVARQEIVEEQDYYTEPQSWLRSV